jgi:hypothetical protein
MGNSSNVKNSIILFRVRGKGLLRATGTPAEGKPKLKRNPETFPAHAPRLRAVGMEALQDHRNRAHYIKDVPEVTENAMSQVELLFTQLEGSVQ